MIFSRKYKIRWFECHNPENWADDFNYDVETGKKNILASYPYVEHWIADDGWLEGTCEDTIEARSPKEAKEKAFDYFECEVFDIYDENGKLVATEEGVMVDEEKRNFIRNLRNWIARRKSGSNC